MCIASYARLLIDWKSTIATDRITNSPSARGARASPGATGGQIGVTADEAVEKARHGAKKNPVILVRAETTPEDIHGMEVADGILTSRGGMTSHAAVVTRGMGKCCVVGAKSISIDERNKVLTAGGKQLREGAWITLEGSTGKVFEGEVPTIDPNPASGDLAEIIAIAD